MRWCVWHLERSYGTGTSSRNRAGIEPLAYKTPRLTNSAHSTYWARARITPSEGSPGSSTGGSERCFHASTFPLLERNSSSCVASLRLWGRRAPARGIPMLRGKTCPSFARSCARSCAARRRASAPSQGTTYWAHEGVRSAAGSR